MKVIEFRIPLPISLEMFQRCALYLVAQASMKEVEGGSAFEIATNEPYERNGTVGRHTEKRYHFGKNLPSWLQTLLGTELTVVSEESWATYPYTFTKYSNKKLTSFEFSFESINIESLEYKDNALNLNAKDLARRKVVVLDLTGFNKCKLYDAASDVTLNTSQFTNVLPIQQGWMDEPGRTGMVSYKVLKVDIPYFGFLTSRVENYLVNYLQDRLLVYLSHAMCAIDEWYDTDIELLRAKEQECYDLLNEKFLEQYGKMAKAGTTGAVSQTSLRDADSQNYESEEQDTSTTEQIHQSGRGTSDEPQTLADKMQDVLTEQHTDTLAPNMVYRATGTDMETGTTIVGRRSTGDKSQRSDSRWSPSAVTIDSHIDEDEFWDCLEELDEHSPPYMPKSTFQSASPAVSIASDDESSRSDAKDQREAEPQLDEPEPAETTEPPSPAPQSEADSVSEEQESHTLEDADNEADEGDNHPSPRSSSEAPTSDTDGDESYASTDLEAKIAEYPEPQSSDEDDTSPELVSMGGKNTPLIFTGYLHKLGGTLFYQWNVRYIMIRDGNMYYYDKSEDTEPKATISLADARISWVGDYMRRSNVFSITTRTKRIYHWSADNRSTVKRWILLLQVLSEESPELLIDDLSTEYLYRVGKPKSDGGNLVQPVEERSDVI
ncbi:Phosphatidylinositol transfer protein 1 [Babesia sp. Xinjiang]|uniref:Phosphatidylinositol transfer protein 1 n=1 Tax=Babesia sp. Xinjiang TaxID=462227 RepID=UPI000A262F80|nr:Phosphatidylinositol transfer protein 1 [Babesia sp. Xinjiang]ORM40302.1 Phosphatidylinositol transfer protein 1 [Babesia sp. Xinjiang]